MIVLQIELGPELGELFATVVKEMEAKLNGQIPNEVQLPEDPEMVEFWSEELRAQLIDDFSALDRLFSHPEFGVGDVEFEEPEAEHLIRAISASRLAIRRLDLGEIDDADLEGRMLAINQMAERMRPSYLCYLFLGGLQETIIQALDPDAVSFSEGFLEELADEEEEDSDPA